MNKLNKLYEAMLKSWGCVIDEGGGIMLNFAGVSVPVKVDDKQTFLPTSDNLNGITVGKVFFHPACESIMSKETEIFKVIRKLTCAKIYEVFQPICDVLFTVANSKSGKTLTNKTLELLAPFKGVNKNVRNEVVEIIKKISITLEDQSIDTRLINFSLIKGGKNEDDEPVYYTATPSFPFYTELYRTVAQNDHLKNSDHMTFNNMNVSMHSLRIVIALFETAFPACTDPSRKKFSVTSPDSARLLAYMHSYGLVVSDLNSLIGKFRKEFDAIGLYGINIDYLSDLDEIGEIKKLIPPLDYNNYNISSSPEQPAANSGARISSYNPLAGIVNTSSSNQGSSNGAIPSQAPKVPDALPGETYIGCDYSQSNGVYEFRFQQSSGMIRVRSLGEDGHLITETFQQPQGMGQNNYPVNMGMQNPYAMQPMNMGMQSPYGGNMAPAPGYARDPYTGQLVPLPPQGMGQQPQYDQSLGNGYPAVSPSFNDYGTSSINNF